MKSIGGQAFSLKGIFRTELIDFVVCVYLKFVLNFTSILVHGTEVYMVDTHLKISDFVKLVYL